MEIVKPKYGDKISPKTELEINNLFIKILSILQPFMPFISSEIFDKISISNDNLEWPKTHNINSKIIRNFEHTNELVSKMKEGQFSSIEVCKAYIERITLNPADYAIRATKHAESTLLAGFTTVRNLGDSDLVTISLRNAINNGIVVGPRIFSSGQTISSTGGHGDSSNSLNLKLTSDLGPKEGVMNGEQEALKSVRYRYKENADLIKITATGGVLSNAKDGQNPQMTIQEISAIVNAAKDYGFKVAAHAHGAEGIKRATIAGVDSIEHGTLMDSEGAALMREKGTYYVPTLLAGKWVADKALIPDYYPPFVEKKALEIGPKLKSTFSILPLIKMILLCSKPSIKIDESILFGNE